MSKATKERKRPRPDVPSAARLPGGTFLMGSERHYREEAPTHRVRVGPFSIDPLLVTNEEFAAFVRATRHVTVAERPVDPAEYPGAAYSHSASVGREPEPITDVGARLAWTVVSMANDWTTVFPPARELTKHLR